MARIVMTTFGSAGDLNPFLAIAAGLRARGHEIVFAVEESFRPQVVAAGFEARRLSGESATMLAPYARQLFSGRTPVESLRVLLDAYILPTLPAKVTELRAICADADLLVSSAANVPAAAVADLTGMPWASVALSPSVLPSAYVEAAQVALPLPEALQRLSNRMVWALGRLTLRRLADAPVNRYRASIGLPPRRDVFWLGSLSDQLTVLACSPAFQPPAPDWPAFVRTTGFCFWDLSTGWAPEPRLTRFLETTQPVIAVTAGSIAPEAAEIFTPYYAASVQAIRRLGGRALVVGAAGAALPEGEDTLAVASVPFSYLFPRCAAVIQHGGIGTVAQAIRAGVPSLVVPWGVDQFYSGVRLIRLPAGTMLTRRRATPERMRRELRRLMDSQQVKSSLTHLRAAIAAEDGVTATCDALATALPGVP